MKNPAALFTTAKTTGTIQACISKGLVQEDVAWVHAHTHTDITQLQKKTAPSAVNMDEPREYHAPSEVSHTEKDKYMVSLMGGT